MEPVKEESTAQQPARPPNLMQQEPFTQTTPKHHVFKDVPSNKYKDLSEMMKSSISKQAHAPPSPTLPR